MFTYICSISRITVGLEKCQPQLRLPQGNQWKGIVVFFHGYSACPQQFNDLGDILASQGFSVLVPTLPGHGRGFYSNCTNLPPSVTDCVLPGYDVSDIPVSYGPYVQFVNDINAMVAEHVSVMKQQYPTVQPVVFVSGLSLGGALAAVAAANGNGLYTRQLMLNPFFGMTIPDQDRAWANCLAQKSASQCVDDFISRTFGFEASQQFTDVDWRKIITTEVKTFIRKMVLKIATDFGVVSNMTYGYMQSALRYALQLCADQPDVVRRIMSIASQDYDKLVSNPFGWGPGCENARANASRGGICMFRIRNLLGAHALGAYAMRVAKQTQNVQSQTIIVERDGFTRNGFTLQVLQSVLAGKTSRATICIHRLAVGCNVTSDNTCGMAHAALGQADNVLVPGGYWWKDILQAGFYSFITAGTTYGRPMPWDGSKESCMAFDPLNLQAADPTGFLLSLPLKVFTLRLNFPFAKWAYEAQLSFLQRLATKLGVNPQIVNVLSAQEGSVILRLTIPEESFSSAVNLVLQCGYDQNCLGNDLPVLDSSIDVPQQA